MTDQQAEMQKAFEILRTIRNNTTSEQFQWMVLALCFDEPNYMDGLMLAGVAAYNVFKSKKKEPQR
jgi:hypothetical protein